MQNLVALALSILVGGILLIAFANIAHNYDENTKDARYAATAGYVTSGTRTFASTQRSRIFTDLAGAGGNAFVYHVSDLVTAGDLDPSTNPVTPTGGTWCFMFRLIDAGSQLQGVATVVGETAPKKAADANLVALASGIYGTGTVQPGNIALGQDINQPLNVFTGAGACKPAVNAFVAVITDQDSIGTTNYLARVIIPGNPSANIMATALGMGGNDITNANNVNAKRMSLTGVPATADGQAVVVDLRTQTIEDSGPANTGPLTVTGPGSATGTFTAPDFFQTSDERLKRDWQPIPNPCATLDAIRAGRYTQIETGAADIGVGAQSVVAAGLPELVQPRADGLNTVNYNGLIPVLMACLADTRARLSVAIGHRHHQYRAVAATGGHR
jgi:hypothetical protein